MNKSAEVVVIGGGVIGCSIAYYLATKGVKAIVIERGGRVAFGASGSNQGGAAFSLRPADSPVGKLARESIKLYRSLSEKIEYDIECENTGSLLCSIDEEQHAAMVKHAQNLQRSGINAHSIEGDRIRELEPSLGKDIIVGMEEQEGITVNPFKVSFGFASAARKLGTEFLFSTEAKEIETNKGNITSVLTDKGKIRTNLVVNAAGAWSPEIGKMLGLTIPIVPRRGQVIVTEPVPLNKRWRYILDADYLTTASDMEAVKKSKDLRVKLGVAGSYIQENTGNWLIGSSHDFAGYNNQVTLQTVKYLATRVIKFMPMLKDVSCIRIFAGLRPSCYVDGLPILDKVDNPSGFIIATGHGGEGLNLAPITGKLISELITENRTSMAIDIFSFSRFKNMN